MPPVGFDKEGFVGFVGVGSVLVMVVKAAFGQVCDVQQVFERVLRPQNVFIVSASAVNYRHEQKNLPKRYQSRA
ncbi:hypothetical protein, partial [Neisseria mucosa]|uniref:hypothetical protein n=1 Tax=Neisseria mucosa TaxID=488 RepID=UPI0027E0E320